MTAESRPSVPMIDDDVENCQNLSDILTDLGYRVDPALDGPSGRASVQARPPRPA